MGIETINHPLECTPNGIPIRLRPFFQELVLEDLDPEKSAFTVISRTMAWGDIRELRWLFGLYGTDRLKAWVREYGWRCLPRRRFQFWLCYFELTDYHSGERIWPH